MIVSMNNNTNVCVCACVVSQLSELYGQDKKTSLMHFLIQQIHSNKPELLDMSQELERVTKSADGKLLNNMHIVIVSRSLI